MSNGSLSVGHNGNESCLSQQVIRRSEILAKAHFEPSAILNIKFQLELQADLTSGNEERHRQSLIESGGVGNIFEVMDH